MLVLWSNALSPGDPPTKPVRTALLVVLSMALALGSARAATLRVGIQDDPDALDPALSGTYIGRFVFAALCDKLVDIECGCAKGPVIVVYASAGEFDGLPIELKAFVNRPCQRSNPKRGLDLIENPAVSQDLRDRAK